jgi:hypothetical protein
MTTNNSRTNAYTHTTMQLAIVLAIQPGTLGRYRNYEGFPKGVTIRQGVELYWNPTPVLEWFTARAMRPGFGTHSRFALQQGLQRSTAKGKKAVSRKASLPTSKLNSR